MEYTKGRGEDLAKPMSAKDVYPVKIFFWVKNRIKLVASLKGGLLMRELKAFCNRQEGFKGGGSETLIEVFLQECGTSEINVSP